MMAHVQIAQHSSGVSSDLSEQLQVTCYLEHTNHLLLRRRKLPPGSHEGNAYVAVTTTRHAQQNRVQSVPICLVSALRPGDLPKFALPSFPACNGGKDEYNMAKEDHS